MNTYKLTALASSCSKDVSGLTHLQGVSYLAGMAGRRNFSMWWALSMSC